MNSRSENQGRMILAVILIGLGVVLLLGQLFDFSLIGTFWPFIIILPGLVFLYFAVKGEPGMAALAIPGAIVTGTGAILLFQQLTGRWESWAYIWTLYPVFLGLGLIYMGQRTNTAGTYQTGRAFVQWGLIGFVVFGAFFELLVFGGGFGLFGRFTWPLLLILLGGFLLLRTVRPDLLSTGRRSGGERKQKSAMEDEPPLFTGAPVVSPRTGYAPSASDRLRQQIDAALAEPEPPSAVPTPMPEPAAPAVESAPGEAATVEFYDVKIRAKVQLPLSSVVKTTFTTDEGQVRYGLRGRTADGRKLTKFVSQETWNSLNVPVEE